VADQQVLSVHEAADILGVSMQRVRQMIHAGQIDARRSSAGWLIPADAVADGKRLHRGRPPKSQTAWSAVALLAAAADLASGATPAHTRSAGQVVPDRKLRHRVLSMLASMPDPVADDAPWRRLLSSRGHVRRMWAHPGVLDRLAADPMVANGGADAALPTQSCLTGRGDRLELYVGDVDADELIRRYRMREDRDGQVNLVIVPSSVPAALAPEAGRPVPAPAAAADLLEEKDPRAHYAAATQLQYFQRALREVGWLDRVAPGPTRQPGAL
jgi:excisionase family DNA binding protein